MSINVFSLLSLKDMLAFMNTQIAPEGSNAIPTVYIYMDSQWVIVFYLFPTSFV